MWNLGQIHLHITLSFFKFTVGLTECRQKLWMQLQLCSGGKILWWTLQKTWQSKASNFHLTHLTIGCQCNLNPITWLCSLFFSLFSQIVVSLCGKIKLSKTCETVFSKHCNYGDRTVGEWQNRQTIWKKCYLHDFIFVELQCMMWPGLHQKTLHLCNNHFCHHF